MTKRIAILGAGPIGLEAALYAQSLKLPVTVYERSQIGEYLRYWGHVRLFSPFGMNVTPLGRAAILAERPKHTFPEDAECITGWQHRASYLEPLAQCAGLRDCIKTGVEVSAIGRRGLLKEEAVGDPRRGQAPFRILLRGEKSHEFTEEADIVLDCTGTYGVHRWMGDGGIPAVGERSIEQQVAYGLEDVLGNRKELYAGRSVLVVGSGYSAATTANSLAALAEERQETWVVWLSRGMSTQPLPRIPNDPLRERDRLAVRANTLATRTDANLEFHNQTHIEAIETMGDKGYRVQTRCAGKPRTFEVERIIANVGYGPDNRLYRELQVHECYASLGPMKLAATLQKHAGGDCLAIPSAGVETLRNPEPGFFVLGAKSYGRNSLFLLKHGFAQVRDVFALIMANNA